MSKAHKNEKAILAIQGACKALEWRPALVNADYLEAMVIDEDPCIQLRIAVTALELAVLAKQAELDVLQIALMLAQAALDECLMNQDPPPPDPGTDPAAP